MSKCRYDKGMIIGPSLCDFSGRLSLQDALAIFMDIAAEHADKLGIGLKYLAKENSFWLTEKTRIHFNRRPFMGEAVEVSTWPEQPDGTRCSRDYTITDNGKVLVEGKTLWAIMDMKAGKLREVKDVYPKDIDILENVVLPEGFTKFDDENFGGELLGEYTVNSADIDIGNHMNNAAYGKALASLFSTEELKKADFTELEIHYKGQCHEGEKLTFMKKQEDGTLKILAYSAKGKVVCRFILLH